MAATCRQIAHVWEINNSGMEWFETKLRPPIGTIASVLLPRVEDLWHSRLPSLFVLCSSDTSLQGDHHGQKIDLSCASRLFYLLPEARRFFSANDHLNIALQTPKGG